MQSYAIILGVPTAFNQTPTTYKVRVRSMQLPSRVWYGALSKHTLRIEFKLNSANALNEYRMVALPQQRPDAAHSVGKLI